MLKNNCKKIILCLFLLLNFSAGSAQQTNGTHALPNPGYTDLAFTVVPAKYSSIRFGIGQDLQPAGISNPYVKQHSFASVPVFPSQAAMRAEGENKNILGMFLLAGYGRLRYNTYNESLYTMDASFIKGGGASYEIPLEVFKNKFSFYNELGFSLFKSNESLHYGDTIGGDPVNNYYDINLTFSPNMIYIANTLRYTFTPGEFKYYVSLGILSSFVVSSVNTKETLHTTNGETKRYVDEFVPDPAVFGITVPVSTGFTYRNVGFEIRFDPGRNFSNKLNYAIYMPAFDALLHVRFIPRSVN